MWTKNFYANLRKNTAVPFESDPFISPNVAAKADGYESQSMTFTTAPFDNSKQLNFKLRPGQKPADTGNATATTITFKKDMPLREALQMLGKAYKKNIIPSDKITGIIPVTDLYDITSVEQVLQAILGTNKYVVDGNFIRVYTEDEFRNLPPTHSSAFIATLPEGVTVELIGICKDPLQDNQEWWLPNGSIYTAPQYEKPQKKSWTNPFFGYLVKITPSEELSFDSSNSSGCPEMTFKSGDNVVVAGGWMKPSEKCPDLIDIEMKIAGGEWQQPDVAPNNMIYPDFVRLVGKDSGITLSGLRSNPDTKLILKTLLEVTTKEQDLDVRLVAKLKNNEKIISEWNSKKPFGGLLQYELGFRCNIDQIEKISVQYRWFQKVIFKNVSLRPGQKTEVEIELRQLQSTPQKPRAAAAAPVSIRNGTASFTAALPNNVKIELLGICEYPSEGKTWWSPNGDILSEAPYATTGNTQNHDKEGYQNYEFALRLEPQDASYTWIIPQSSFGSDTGSPKDRNGRDVAALKSYQAGLPKDRQIATIRVGATNAPWQTVATHTPQDKEQTLKAGDYEIAFGRVYVKDKETLLPIVHNYNRGESLYAIRVVAITKSGQVIKSGYSGKGGLMLNNLTYSFYDLPVDTIREFQFQIRPYEWVTFQNVPLRPGQKTEVEIEPSSTIGSSSSGEQAEAFGQVTEKSKPLTGYRVIATVYGSDASSAKPSKVLFSQETKTNDSGYYHVKALPPGRLTIAIMSRIGNLNVAQKIVTLSAGQKLELNFGDESGYPVAGTVLLDGTPVELAAISIMPNFPQTNPSFTKWGWTDKKGTFRITGVPEGKYKIFVDYNTGLNPKTFMVEEGKTFIGPFSNISLTEPMNVNVDIFSTKTYPDYMIMHIQDGKQTISLRPGQKTEVKTETLHNTASKSFDLTSPTGFVSELFEEWKTEVKNNYLLLDYEIKQEYVLEGKTGAVAYVWFKTTLKDIRNNQTHPFDAVYFLYRWHTDQWEGIFNTDGTNSTETDEMMEIYRRRWCPDYLKQIEEGYTRPGGMPRTAPAQTKAKIETQNSGVSSVATAKPEDAATEPNETQIAVEARFILADEAVLKQAGIDLNKTLGTVTTLPADSNDIVNLLKNNSLENMTVEPSDPNLLDDSQVKSLMELVQQSKNSKMLSSPKALVRNTESATIKIAANTEYFDANHQKKTFERGTQLTICPQADDAGQNIAVKVRVLMSDLLKPNTQQAAAVPQAQVLDVPYQAIVPNEMFFWLLAPQGFFEPSLTSDENTTIDRRLLILIKPTITVPQEQTNLPQSIGGMSGGGGGGIGGGMGGGFGGGGTNQPD